MVIHQHQYSLISTGLQKRPPRKPKVNVDNLLIYDGRNENSKKQQESSKSIDSGSNRRGLYIVPKCEPSPEILQGREPESSRRYRNSRSHQLNDREDRDQQREEMLVRYRSSPPSSPRRTMRGQQQRAVQREYAISPSHKMKRTISPDRCLARNTNAKLYVSPTKSTHSPKSPRSYKSSRSLRSPRSPRSPRKTGAPEIESAKGARVSSHMPQQQKQQSARPRSRSRQTSIRIVLPEDTSEALDDEVTSYLESCMGAFDLYDFLESVAERHERFQRYLQQRRQEYNSRRRHSF